MHFVPQDEMKQLAKNERFAVTASNVCNLILFGAKVFASYESRSLAVLASTLDSLLDLLSGFILWFTSYSMKKPNHYHYPIGKKRMQPVVRLDSHFKLQSLISPLNFLVNSIHQCNFIMSWEWEWKFVLIGFYAGYHCFRISYGNLGVEYFDWILQATCCEGNSDQL